jgi:hypothetical protein
VLRVFPIRSSLPSIPRQPNHQIRTGCVASVRKYRSLAVRVPAVIHVMDLLQSEGKDGLARILERGNPEAQACGEWRPRLKRK